MRVVVGAGLYGWRCNDDSVLQVTQESSEMDNSTFAKKLTIALDNVTIVNRVEGTQDKPPSTKKKPHEMRSPMEEYLVQDASSPEQEWAALVNLEKSQQEYANEVAKIIMRHIEDCELKHDMVTAMKMLGQEQFNRGWIRQYGVAEHLQDYCWNLLKRVMMAKFRSQLQ